MKYEEMVQALTRVACLFPNITLTKEFVTAWYENFRSEDITEFYGALKVAANEPGREFFPTPGVVRKYLETKESCAEEEWMELQSLAQRGVKMFELNSMYGEDSLVMKAVRSVGWDRIRLSDYEKELPFVRKNFISAYNSMHESDSHNDRVQIGREEARNVLGSLFSGDSDVKKIEQ